jgi:hypothetical protein
MTYNISYNIEETGEKGKRIKIKGKRVHLLQFIFLIHVYESTQNCCIVPDVIRISRIT